MKAVNNQKRLMTMASVAEKVAEGRIMEKTAKKKI